MFLRTLGRAMLVVTLACVPLTMGPAAPAAAARPVPGFVELQGNLWHVDAGLQFQPVAFLENAQNIRGMQVVFVVDFDTGTDPAPYRAALMRSGYPRNPIAFAPMVDIPAQASTVTVTATLQHVSSKTGLVDQTYSTLSGTGVIDRGLQLGEEAQIIYVTP